MIQLTAKQHFQKTQDPDAIADLGDKINSSMMRTAMIHCQAHMIEARYTQEQMTGASLFISLLMNICVEDKENSQIPMKSLKEFPIEQTK